MREQLEIESDRLPATRRSRSVARIDKEMPKSPRTGDRLATGAAPEAKYAR
jgi:hypothetical protein